MLLLELGGMAYISADEALKRIPVLRAFMFKLVERTKKTLIKSAKNRH